MNAILKILTAIATALDLIARAVRRREQKKHDEEVRDAQEDPHEWFDGHFNDGADGVPDVPDDAKPTGKADSAEPAENAKRRDTAGQD